MPTPSRKKLTPTRRPVSRPKRPHYIHGATYVYDATSQTFDLCGTTASPDPRPMTDKWVLGMVDEGAPFPRVKFFTYPDAHSNYSTAVRAGEEGYRKYGKPFVVFAKVCYIGPSAPPPAVKREFRA
jgi:hypothetical protein